jgi:hypothetical protein
MSEGCIGSSDNSTVRHNIQSLRTAEMIDPHTKTIVGEYKLICSGCGQSLEEIHSPKKTRKPRKKNGEEAPATEDVTQSLD